MDIENAVVIVTGASSGIGAATARAAAAAGARVVLAARREDRIAALAAELDGAIAVGCDVTDAEQVASLVKTALTAHGRIDVVINNAGQGLHVPVEALALDDLRAVLDLNLVAPLAVMQAVIPVMRAQGGGSIVNISSGTTLGAQPNTGGYVASKIALERLSAVARAELAGDGIVVSVLLPFATRTEFIGTLRSGSEEAGRDMADVDFDGPERVADAILDLVRTGAERADLVPAEYGGSRR